MIHDVVFIPEALADVMEARAWYEGHSTSLGDRFLDHVDDCIDRVPIRSPSMPSFTALRIRENGAAVCREFQRDEYEYRFAEYEHEYDLGPKPNKPLDRSGRTAESR